MNLDAIQPHKRATEAQAGAQNAQRSVSATYGNLLFKKVPAPLQTAIVAKATANHVPAPVKPVALATPTSAALPGDLTAVLKAMTDGFSKLTAAVSGPVQKAAPAAQPVAVPAAPAPGLNVMLGSGSKRDRVAKTAEAQARQALPSAVPAAVEAQRRREAEAREQARRDAAKAQADHVLTAKAGGRVRVLKVLDPSLSDAALMALSHVVAKYEANGRQSVPVNGPDLSRALDIPLIAAQAGYAELVNKGHVSSAKNSLGVTQVTPRIAAAGL